MKARKKRRARKQPIPPAAKPVSAYDQIIDAISLIEIVKRSMDQEAYELVALKHACRCLWLVHDQLDALGIGGSTDADEGEDE
jgi:hypothetical protein